VLGQIVGIIFGKLIVAFGLSFGTWCIKSTNGCVEDMQKHAMN
jgi:hypothetical protein